jgi:glycosyltransferase involved in cell wall biosynthesis
MVPLTLHNHKIGKIIKDHLVTLDNIYFNKIEDTNELELYYKQEKICKINGDCTPDEIQRSFISKVAELKPEDEFHQWHNKYFKKFGIHLDHADFVDNSKNRTTVLYILGEKATTFGPSAAGFGSLSKQLNEAKEAASYIYMKYRINDLPENFYINEINKRVNHECKFNPIDTKSKLLNLQLGKLTVVIPVYNAARTIHDCLESIRTQSYQNLEVYVVDDNSTDNSIDVVHKYLNKVKDKRFKFYKTTKNCGPYAIKNLVLLQENIGEFYTILDSDDTSTFDRFEKKIEYLKTQPLVGGVSCYMHEFCEKDPYDILYENHPWRNAMIAGKRKYEKEEDGLYHNYVQYPDTNPAEPNLKNPRHFLLAAGLLTYTKYLVSIGGFDGTSKVGADTEMMNRLRRIIRMDTIPYYLYNRRIDDNNLTVSKSTSIGSDFRKIYRDYIDNVCLKTSIYYEKNHSLPNIDIKFVLPKDVELLQLH